MALNEAGRLRCWVNVGADETRPVSTRKEEAHDGGSFVYGTAVNADKADGGSDVGRHSSDAEENAKVFDSGGNIRDLDDVSDEGH